MSPWICMKKSKFTPPPIEWEKKHMGILYRMNCVAHSNRRTKWSQGSQPNCADIRVHVSRCWCIRRIYVYLSHMIIIFRDACDVNEYRENKKNMKRNLIYPQHWYSPTPYIDTYICIRVYASTKKRTKENTLLHPHMGRNEKQITKIYFFEKKKKSFRYLEDSTK